MSTPKPLSLREEVDQLFGTRGMSQEQLKASLLQLFSDALQEVIGKDETWNVKKNFGYRQQNQNDLRAIQRKTAEALLGKKEA